MTIIVTLHNDDLEELIVSVRDLNRVGESLIVDRSRLPVDQLLSIAVEENESGTRGNIFWRAQRADDPDATASERSVEVEAAATVQLSANFR